MCVCARVRACQRVRVSACVRARALNLHLIVGVLHIEEETGSLQRESERQRQRQRQRETPSQTDRQPAP